MTQRASRIAPQKLLKIPPSKLNYRYKQFIRSQPCLACGQNWGIEACHTGPRGLGQKASDLDTIPLCARCHVYGDHSYHVLGRDRFERERHIVIADAIRAFQLAAGAAGIDLSVSDPPRKPFGKAGEIRRKRRRSA